MAWPTGYRGQAPGLVSAFGAVGPAGIFGKESSRTRDPRRTGRRGSAQHAGTRLWRDGKVGHGERSGAAVESDAARIAARAAEGQADLLDVLHRVGESVIG